MQTLYTSEYRLLKFTFHATFLAKRRKDSNDTVKKRKIKNIRFIKKEEETIGHFFGYIYVIQSRRKWSKSREKNIIKKKSKLPFVALHLKTKNETKFLVYSQIMTTKYKKKCMPLKWWVALWNREYFTFFSKEKWSFDVLQVCTWIYFRRAYK